MLVLSERFVSFMDCLTSAHLERSGSFFKPTVFRLILTGLRGEDSIAELCRQEGIA